MRWTTLGLLVAGAACVINVAVAWACAMYSAAGPIQIYANFGGRWLAPVPADWPSSGHTLIVCEGVGVEWKGLATPDTTPRDRGCGQTVCRSGWPFFALQSERRAVPDSPHPSRGKSRTWREGIVVHGPAAQWAWPSERMLPLVPVWFGFGANTLLFAVLLFIPFAVPRARRWNRRRRSRCVRCNHQLLPEQSLCTECGQRAKPSAHRTSEMEDPSSSAIAR